MKRINSLLFVTIAMFTLSVNSAWAQYVKLTAPNGTVSWIEINGTINGTNIEVYKGEFESAINENTKGSIDLNEVWSNSDGSGTHYQVTKIGNDAFFRCKGLTSVEIPSSVTRIGSSAFYECIGLTSVEIPSNVTSIGTSTFSGCIGLTSIEIPSSVTSIGNCVFEGCVGLTSVVIPSNVTDLGLYPFGDCSGLTSIVVESGNSVYDSRNNCNAIIETASNTLIAGCKNTKIPSSVTSIGDWAFEGCSGLTSIDIPSRVTRIEIGAFNQCSGLTSIDIPSSVTSIENYVFEGCVSLTSVVIPSSVTSIGDGAFQYCSGLTSVVIPSSVTSIGDGAFQYCSGLTSVVIPSSVTSIGNGAFQYCSGLTSVEIPSGVTSIGSNTFGGCYSMTSIVIPSSVTSIGDYAFEWCSSITSITSYIKKVFETGQDAFNGCDNATLYVPKGLVGTYQSTSDWNRISNIEEMISVVPLSLSCNNKGKVLINDGVQFTNDVGEVSVIDGMDNTFVFTPNNNCELRQVLIDGLDVTLSVENNQLTTKVHEGSKMIVMFDKKGADVNGDGQLNISDVVALVNLILGQ